MSKLAVMKIEEVPDYANEYPVWIVRIDEKTRDKAWFFGAYDSEEHAKNIIEDIHRAVIVKNPHMKEVG